MKVYLSISWGAFQRAHHIFIQNCVEAKLLEPQHWNFAWINGRLCALRQNQSGFLNMNTLGTIKVLLVPVAFESRVNPSLKAQILSVIIKKATLPCVQKQVIPAKPLLCLKYSFWEIQIGFIWKHITYHLFTQIFIALDAEMFHTKIPYHSHSLCHKLWG